MKMNEASLQVDQLIADDFKWGETMAFLRAILMKTDLVETIKWGKPCYTTTDGKNVVLIQPFKTYCALLFFKGMLMEDSENRLVKTGPNTRVGRQIKFTGEEDLTSETQIIENYVQNAIEVELSGVKIEAAPEKAALPIPVEFQEEMDGNESLKNAFLALTPGRQKAYIRHFSEPKRVETKISRIKKAIPAILNGKGLNDFPH